MTELDAEKLCQLVCDQYGRDAGRLVPLSDGREYAVRIARERGCWFLWDWKCWTAYRHQEKQKLQRKRGRPRREEVLHAISYSEVFSLAM